MSYGPVVIDTNVPLVASERAPQASASCVAVCAGRVADVMKRGQVVVDDGGQIIREYVDNFRSIGQPRVCDMFLKWVLTNQMNPKKCSLVQIAPDRDRPGEFVEFPQDPSLAGFDVSDRKFVAVALAHPARPPILQAVDSGWWRVRAALRAQGVVVEYLCPKDIAAFHRAQLPS